MSILEEEYYGGLICHVNYNKEAPFKLFMKMVNNPTCKISKIAYSSLKGFILKLDIDRPSNLDKIDAIAPFLGLNIQKTKYDVPVYTLVIKLVILSSKETNMRKYISLDRETFNKQTDIYSDFEKEAKTQSEIYKNTINKGEPVCPSLVAIAKMTEMSISLEFLRLLKEKCGTNTEAENMVSYVMNEMQYNTSYQLGVIVMESASEYKTIHSFLNGEGILNRYTKNSQYDVLCQLLFMIIRLLEETGYIHCDLHLNNAMVKYDGNKIVMRLIDFGRVVNVDEKSIPLIIDDEIKFIIDNEINYNESKGFGPFSRLKQYFDMLFATNKNDKFLDKVDNQLIIYEKGKDTINSDCYRLIKNYYPKKEDLNSIDEEKLKRERITAEKQRQEQERLTAEKQRQEQERLTAEKQRQEQERLTAAEKQRQEQERLAAEQQPQKQALTRRQMRVAAVNAQFEKEKAEKVEKAEKEKAEKAEKERIEKEIAEQNKKRSSMRFMPDFLNRFRTALPGAAVPAVAAAGGTRKKRRKRTIKKRVRSSKKRLINK
jgi:flagellar biosynthesis GTPase FlhF